MVRKARHRHANTPTKTNRTRSPKPKTFRAVLAGIGIAAVAATAALTMPIGATAATSYTTGQTVVSDAFARSVANGWGSAPIGGAYTVSSSAGQSVTPSSGGTLE